MQSYLEILKQFKALRPVIVAKNKRQGAGNCPHCNNELVHTPKSIQHPKGVRPVDYEDAMECDYCNVPVDKSGKALYGHMGEPPAGRRE